MSKTALAGVFGFAKQSARDVTVLGPYNNSGPSAGTNEVQTATISGGPTSGDLVWSFDGYDFTAPYNETPANVQAGFRALPSLGSPNVTVTGTAGVSYVFTFVAEFGARNASPITVDYSDLDQGSVLIVTTTPGVAGTTGHNEVQVAIAAGTPTDGNLVWGYGASQAILDFDASTADVEAAFESFDEIGVGNIDVGGTAGEIYVFTFQGDLAKTNVSAITLDDADLDTGTFTMFTRTAGVPDSDDGVWTFIPANSVNFQKNQIVTAIPPEVGGSDYSRGSYKGGVSGQGAVNFIPRAGLGLAELLRGMSGVVTKVAGDGLNGAAVGNFIYTYKPSAAGVELAWYTFVRNVAGAHTEEFADGQVGSFAFDMAATGLLTIDASFVSRKCRDIDKTSGGTTTEQVGNQLAGNGPRFQAVDTIIKIDSNTGDGPGGIELTAYKPTRLNIGFTNQLTSDEFVIGSHFLEDITRVARSAAISYGLRLKDAEINNRVYGYGAGNSAGTADVDWSPRIWKGALWVKFLTQETIGATLDVYSLVVDIPEMDYQAAPVGLSGNQVVEYQLMTNVVLSDNPAVSPFTLTYVTDEDIEV